jgi:hypothetical protein
MHHEPEHVLDGEFQLLAVVGGGELLSAADLGLVLASVAGFAQLFSP